MSRSSRLSPVSPTFRARVRIECNRAAIEGQPIGYRELAEVTIGDADRGSSECRFIRHVDAALCLNMAEDAAAGRPFSAVAVQPEGGNFPGIGFFECAWELGRFKDNDCRSFANSEWTALRRSLLSDDVPSATA